MRTFVNEDTDTDLLYDLIEYYLFINEYLDYGN